MNYQQLEKLYNDLRDEKAQLLGRKAELLKTPTEVAKKRDDYLKHHLIGLGPAAIEGLLRKMDSFDYSILGHQISVNSANIVDRCEVCHVGIREPLNIKAEDLAPDGPGKAPDSLARAFVSHPDKELLRVHNPDRFGCSGCHWGNGRATTGEIKGHGRHKYWLWPLFEKENIEAKRARPDSACLALAGLVPLFWYGLITLAIPLLNSALAKEGSRFAEHGGTVMFGCIIVLAVFISMQWGWTKIKDWKTKRP